MKFKIFLSEIEAENEHDIVDSLSIIKKEMAQMTLEELNDFGDWLYDEIFVGDDHEGSDDDFEYDELVELISVLDSEDVNYIVYMMDYAEEDETDEYDYYDDSTNEDSTNEDNIDEGMSVRFKAKNRNKKKNKRFTLTKAKFRAGKAARKKENRKNKISRKKNYRKNKIKIKKYAKSYNANVKTGKHVKKIRR